MPEGAQENIKPIKIKKPKPMSVFKGFMVKYLGTFMYTMIFGLISTFYSVIFSDASYSVRVFMYTQIGAFILGIIHAVFAPRLISWIDQRASASMMIFLFILCMVGYTVIILSQHIDAIPKIPSKYGWVLIAFAIPTVWAMAYEILLSIPRKEFKNWVYPYGKEIPVVEVVDPIKINFYIEKAIDDDHYAEFTLNVPPKYTLGEFTHYFIHRYNYDKNPDEPIYISHQNKDSNLYHWIFRTKPHSSKNRHVLDPDKSFEEQHLRSNSKIVVERVKVEDRSALDETVFDNQEKIIDET